MLGADYQQRQIFNFVQQELWADKEVGVYGLSSGLTWGSVGSSKAQEEESEQREVLWAGMGLRILY